ncbi:MAG: fluoride efflux transporter CrcB [Pseudomonadota bacterium]
MVYGYVALGGALGSLLRFGLNRWLTLLLGDTLPWGTLLINAGGSFAIGLFAALFAGAGAWSAPLEIRQFLLVGLCGGFTTFSSFSLQTFTLLQGGEPGRALLYVALSLVLCFAAVALGHALPGVFAAAPRGIGP